MSKKTETGCRPDQLFGAWAIEPGRFAAMVDQARVADLAQLRAEAAAAAVSEGRPFDLTDGIATIRVAGPMTKNPHSFQSLLGGTATVRARAALREATRDPDVRGVLLHVESPGGTVAGTDELGEAIRAADERKPVFTFIEDLGASAAYWVAAQSRRIFVNATGAVGSIGVFAVLHDSSGRFEQAGVRVLVVSSGGVKGMGQPGAPISDEQLAEAQRRVDTFTDHFIKAVARGRRLSPSRARELADGRLHVGVQAVEEGLVDAVGTLEDARRQLLRETMSESKTKSGSGATAADLEAAEELLEEANAKIEQLQARNKELEASAKPPEKPKADPLAALSPEARERFDELEQKAKAADEKLARMESDARLKEFTEQARAFKCLPVKAEEFGAVLAAAEGALSAEQWKLLSGTLTAADEQIRQGGLFSEVGTGAASQATSAWGEIEALAKTRHEAGEFKTMQLAIAAVTEDRKDLYERHRAEQRRGAN